MKREVVPSLSSDPAQAAISGQEQDGKSNEELGHALSAAEMYDTCTQALGDFVRNAGFSDVVLGLSGGLDSSVVATMAVDALGAEHVHGMLMPGPYSTAHSVDDAEDLARALGICTRSVSICEPFEAFEHVLARACGGALDGLAAENTQARCRMVCLMAVSNALGWMLLNTGNKTEAMMGYSTLYGDTAGAFAPIGGLYKEDVYAVARYRNRKAAEAGASLPIPIHVLTKKPSAELSPDQTDEASMGIDYVTLDAILKATQEYGKSVDDLVGEGFDAAQVNDILRRVKSYEYKRALEPPYPALEYSEAPKRTC